MELIEGGAVVALDRDDDAFDAFVAARLPHLLRLGRALTGDEQRGADLVQDALERALVRWRRLDDPEAFVRRAMVNRSISVWRKVRRERPLDTASLGPAVHDRPAEDKFLAEGFADRRYLGNGQLIPRGTPGALLETPEDASAQARILTTSGRFQTMCVHGDTPNAVAIARAVRETLDAL